MCLPKGHSCHQWSCSRETDPGKTLGTTEGGQGLKSVTNSDPLAAPALIRTALSCRMDSFEDKLQQLREAFNSGQTRPAEFRAAQLRGLGHFLRDNKQQLQEALAQDLRKVAWSRDGGVGWRVGGVPRSARVVQLEQGSQLSHILQEEELKPRGDPSSFREPQLTVAPTPSVLHILCSCLWETWYGPDTGTRLVSGDTEQSQVPVSTKLTFQRTWW